MKPVVAPIVHEEDSLDTVLNRLEQKVAKVSDKVTEYVNSSNHSVKLKNKCKEKLKAD